MDDWILRFYKANSSKEFSICGWHKNVIDHQMSRKAIPLEHMTWFNGRCVVIRTTRLCWEALLGVSSS